MNIFPAFICSPTFHQKGPTTYIKLQTVLWLSRSAGCDRLVQFNERQGAETTGVFHVVPCDSSGFCINHVFSLCLFVFLCLL
jgi:hypothetical protein